ncbi:MAG TPA: polysaccharide biosynthesis C-terminal domain-containing protein [Chitinophagaceae bacterium]|nr:polysaccharide biosynthesis C-terminal domain-containing protein [Chitinophagaceae bacterium]
MKETSRFYSSLGLLIVLNLIIKPVWIFAIDRGVQNFVGTTEYGHYFSLFNLSIVLGFILDLGFTNYFNRQLATNPDFFKGQTGNFFLLKIILAIIYSGVFICAAYVTGIGRWDIVAGLIFIQVFTFLFVFTRAIITGSQWFRADAWLSVLDKTMMIILCGGFLFIPTIFGHITINLFLFFQAISTFTALMVAVIVLRRRGVSFQISSLHSFFKRKLFVEVLPFTLILLLMSAHIRLDGFMLERIHADGAHEAGVYAASYRLLDAANMIGILFASFVLPYMARQWSSGYDINPVILNIRHILVSFSILTACTMFFLAPWIHRLLYTHSDEYGAGVLRLCMPALIGYSLVSVYGTVMTATGHLYPFCRILLFALAVNVVLNIILIPAYGARGCSIAAIISQVSCGVIAMFYSRNKLHLKMHPASLIIYIFMIILLSGFFYMTEELALNPWLTIILAAMLMVFLVFITRLFDLQNWKQIFKMIH